MTASQVASAIDASIKALILDNYTTEDEVAAIVDSSIKALHLENYATNASVLAAIDASISALNVEQYMTENETAAAINSSITALNISQYATKTLMYSAIDASIAALNVSQYTTDAEVAAIVSSSLNAWIPNASIAEYNNAASKAHTHSNAAILDGIKDASIAQWLKDTSYGTGTVLELNAGTSIVPEVWDASTLAAYFAQESANSVRFCGDFNASTGEVSESGTPLQTLDQISEKRGDMYVASAVGTYLGVDMQIGDSIIFRNAVEKNTAVEVTDVTFVQGAVKVIAKNPTLSWDSSVKIGNVEGVDLYVKTMPMPSKSDIGLGDIDTRVENVSAGLISLNAYALDTSNRLAQVDINLSGRIADVSADLISLGTQTSEKFDALDLVDTTLSGRIADVSAEVISLSAYAGEVSANIVTVNTNLSGRIADVSADLSELATAVSDLSTYAHSVDPDVANRIADVSAEVIALTLYASEVSSNLATVSTRVTDVSADVVSLTGYAENVSSRLDSTNTALLSLINDLSTRFNDLSSNVNIKTHTVDASVQELFNNTAEIETTWAGAWEQLFNDNSTLIR